MGYKEYISPPNNIKPGKIGLNQEETGRENINKDGYNLKIKNKRKMSHFYLMDRWLEVRRDTI